MRERTRDTPIDDAPRSSHRSTCKACENVHNRRNRRHIGTHTPVMSRGYVPPHARGGRRGGKRDATSAAPARATTSATCSPCSTLDECVRYVTTAEKKSRSGEREAAIASFEHAIAGLRALSANAMMGSDQVRSALAEALLAVAREYVYRARSAPLNEMSKCEEEKACAGATLLAQEAVSLYENLTDSLERANGIATSLSQVVELESARSDIIELLGRALTEYDFVAEKTAENKTAAEDGDLLLALWNSADVRLKLAEALCERTNDDESVANNFQQALQLFERGCGHCDSSRGDDLGSFLYDWGCTLTSYAQFLLKRNQMDVAIEVIDAAIAKLRTATKFSLGDVGCLNALGDALQTKSELLNKTSGDDANQGRYVEALLLAAYQEGYNLALKTNASSLDAHVGVGEVHMALGTMYASHDDGIRANEAFNSAWLAYRRALDVKPSKSDAPSACDERFEVVYNAACAASRAGAKEISRELLSQLILCGASTAEAMSDDADLAGIDL